MSKRIKQLRYPENSITDWIDGVDEEKWSSNLLSDLGPILQLGIYALPGTRFKIGSGSSKPFVMNGSGLFYLDASQAPIQYLSLSKNSYDNLENASHIIIIDLVYREVQNND